jgi:SAM-dependent methyltransferase
MNKADKLNRIRPALKGEYIETPDYFDFLSPNLKAKYRVSEYVTVEKTVYDPYALQVIERYPNGLILDIGCGHKSVYYPNVVNMEIAPYDTTDVLGVGEELPFKDSMFEGVISLNVLEHVKDPFLCAKEICRVMKPGATLYCVVPFLQPLHGYPHHYYNMSSSGLANLFESLDVRKQEVILSGHPVFTLTWFLKSWAEGLDEETRQRFKDMKVSDLMGDPQSYFEEAFVKNLPRKQQFELASTTMILATKPCVS